MSEQYIGEIRLFAGNYAPENWALCNGQSMNLNQYQALFSLIGTTYGGDGVTTFNLPNLQAKIAIGQGSAPGLTPRVLGQKLGDAAVGLTIEQLPSHSHSIFASTGTPSVSSGSSAVFSNPGALTTGAYNTYRPVAGATASLTIELPARTITPFGSNTPAAHLNQMPTNGLNYIIALLGIYPSRP
jgi:microcystin-dependent protein